MSQTERWRQYHNSFASLSIIASVSSERPSFCCSLSGRRLKIRQKRLCRSSVESFPQMRSFTPGLLHPFFKTPCVFDPLSSLAPSVRARVSVAGIKELKLSELLCDLACRPMNDWRQFTPTKSIEQAKAPVYENDFFGFVTRSCGGSSMSGVGQ
jgi:hypothetical protein